MATKNEEIWMMYYNEPKAYVAVHCHFPDKYNVEFRGLLNWAKYPRKKIKAGNFVRRVKTLV